MSKRKQTEKKEPGAEKIARALSIEEAKSEIVKELANILTEEEEHNTSKNTLEDLDSTDDLGDRIKEVIGATLEELKDSLSGNEKKKILGSQHLENNKHTAEKQLEGVNETKENNKGSCRKSNELMARSKATVRRMLVPNCVHSPDYRIGNKNIMNRRLRNDPYKIKKLLPEYKRVDDIKNGQIMRSMNVRKKAIYFTGKRMVFN